MKKFSVIIALFVVIASVFALSAPGFAADGEEEDGMVLYAAEEEAKSDSPSSKAIAAAVIISVAAAAGAVGMAIAISKSVSSMARQPEAASKINSSMMLGLVFIETAIIYALIVAILIIFVL